jgi:hypothetical protein
VTTILIALVLTLAPAVSVRAAEPLALLEPMATAYARVQRYTARFVRQEVVDGALRPREEALLKWERPGRIYLRWTAGRPAGREILFVPGQNGGRMLVREPGLLASLATIVMAPDSPRVLEESRHPVTDIGIGRLIDLILDNARRAAAAGELTTRDLSSAVGPEGAGLRVEIVLPASADRGYYCRRLALAIGESSGLPVRAVVYDWADRMVAEYAYLDLKLDPSLAARDFDPTNPDYGFPRWKISR